MAAPTAPLRRVLGRLELAGLGVGAMVGTGVFVLSGQVAAHHAGPAVVLAFGLAGGAALLAALCYADLATKISGPGGAYTFCRALVGRPVAALVGYALLLEYTLAAASVCAGWSAYAGSVATRLLGAWLPAPWATPPWQWDAAAQGLVRSAAWVNLPAVLVALALTALVARGVRASARANMAAVAIKVVVVLAFVLLCAPHVRLENLRPFLPPSQGRLGNFGPGGLARAVGLLFFAYNGFDAIAAASGEARRPSRDLPTATVAAVVVAMALYAACSLVLVGVVPFALLSVPHPLSLGLAACQRSALAPLLELGTLAGLISVILVNLLSQPRIALAMAHDGLLPRGWAAVHPRHGTPARATWLAGTLCAATAGLAPIELLGELMCVGTLFAFAWVAIACLLRRRRAGAGGLSVPAATVAVCLSLLAMQRPSALAALAVYLAAAGAIAMAASRRRPDPTPAGS